MVPNDGPGVDVDSQLGSHQDSRATTSSRQRGWWPFIHIGCVH